MLTALEVYSTRVATAPFSLVGAVETDSIRILGIEGLGPVAADLSMSKMSSLDGEIFRSSTVGKRNIVLDVGLNPDWSTNTYESLRQKLYLLFMPKAKVRLRFLSTHLETVEIDGYVETVTPSIFSKTPEFQVSIICPFPYFRALEDTSDTYPAGAVNTANVDYAGTVETGFVIRISRGSESDVLSYTNIPIQISWFLSGFPEQVLAMGFPNISLPEYSELEISTVPGNKIAVLNTEDIYLSTTTPPQNVLGYMSTSSQWPQLQPGINLIKVEGPEDWVYRLSYRTLYGGL